MEELHKNLKLFQESGVLNRDRLRGTVGYMSPELILAGHSSTATDVWAAGVVLYILVTTTLVLILPYSSVTILFIHQ
jgi:serine/threonine protein kinase